MCSHKSHNLNIGLSAKKCMRTYIGTHIYSINLNFSGSMLAYKYTCMAHAKKRSARMANKTDSCECMQSHILRLTLFVMKRFFIFLYRQTFFQPAAKWCSGISNFLQVILIFFFLQFLFICMVERKMAKVVWGKILWEFFGIKLRRIYYELSWHVVIHIAAVWYFIMKIPLLLFTAVQLETSIYLLSVHTALNNTKLIHFVLSAWKACCENAQFSHFN